MLLTFFIIGPKPVLLKIEKKVQDHFLTYYFSPLDENIFEVNLVRDVPYSSGDKLIINWYPLTYKNVATLYLIQLKNSKKDIKTWTTDKTYLEIPRNESLLKSKYRIFALRLNKSAVEEIGKTWAYFEKIESRWYDFKSEPNETYYLIGEKEVLKGKVKNLNLRLPSGFACDLSNPHKCKSDYILTSADEGSVISVSKGKFTKYLFKNKLKMPLRLGNPVYIGKELYLISDNRDALIYFFNVKSGKLEVAVGKKNKELYTPVSGDQRSFSDFLGIMNKITQDKSEPQKFYVFMSSRASAFENSWYPYSTDALKLYEIDFKDKVINLKKDVSSFCETKGCKAFYPLKNQEQFILRTDKNLIKINHKMKILWSINISPYGSGLAEFKDFILVGDHTNALGVNLKTGAEVIYNVGSVFANIVDIDRISDDEFVITDSDGGSVHFFNRGKKAAKLNFSISASKLKKPELVKVKSYDEDLYVLTSNPSYLYKMNLKTFKIIFFAGDGSNTPASLNRLALKSGLNYPTDFILNENSLYVIESNNRIVKIESGKIKLVAGSIESGKGEGKANCNDPLFSNLRGVIFNNEKIIISDAGNKRLVALQKNKEKCKIKAIRLEDEKKEIGYNFLSHLYKVSDGFYLLEQDANRILKYTNDFKFLKSIGIETTGNYQGQGRDDNKTVSIKESNFSTPSDLCFDPNEDVFVCDLFNGKIKKIKNEMVSSLKIDTDLYNLPLKCTFVKNRLFYIDSMTNNLSEIKNL